VRLRSALDARRHPVVEMLTDAEATADLRRHFHRGVVAVSTDSGPGDAGRL
jgi:hypothetical protein